MGKRKKLNRRQKREARKMTDKKKSNYNPSNFTTTTKSAWKYTPKPPCHTGQLLVFTTDTGVNVYGGGKYRAGGWH